MKKILLIGLGNPGEKFIRTRHNLGIRMLSLWFDKMKKTSDRYKGWRDDPGCTAEVAQLVLGDKVIDCIFPLTYMNESGKSVVRYAQKHGIDISSIIVLHDDLEIPFGEVVFKLQGGAAGHKGIRSIHQHAGTLDVTRIRLGIGRPTGNIPVDRFVLQRFTDEEESKMEIVAQKVEAMLKECFNGS